MPWRQPLMDQAADLVAAERRNHALDLPPVAEARDIALVAAQLGAGRRFVAGVIAESLHKLCRVGKRDPAVNEGRVHGSALSPGPVSTVPTNVVNAALTIFPRPAQGGGNAHQFESGRLLPDDGLARH